MMDNLVPRSQVLSIGTPSSSPELEGLYGELQKETPTKYVNEVPKALECAICYSTYKDAVIMKQCGHSFCYICAIAALNNNKKCPLCKEPVKGKIESALTPNFAVRDQVDSLLVYCPYGLKKK